MYDYDQAKPVMYNVIVEVKGPKRGPVKWERPMAQEELDKAIGRYVRKYGAPVNMSDSKKGPVTLDYYSREDAGTWEVTVVYELTKTSTTATTEFQSRSDFTQAPPPPPLGPQPEAIQKLLDAEVITRVTTWNGRQ